MGERKRGSSQIWETADAAFHRISLLPEQAGTFPAVLLSLRGAGKLVIATERNFIKAGGTCHRGCVSHVGKGVVFHTCTGVQASCEHKIQGFQRW